ncbi:MAG: fibronectin type III domain-containing protein [Planctomycetota bacterium]
MPILIRAMVLADKTLFIAGPPDVVDEEQAFDYWASEPNDPNYNPDIPTKLYAQDAALEGQNGALLWAISAWDGKKLAGYNLDALPVWDGMVAANGRLYISMKNSKVLCFVGENYPPKVNAGEDQNIFPMAIATLDATVTDDGLPKVDPCDPYSAPIGITTSWTKFDGPGEINIGDPCAVDTIASFSQWGDYTLRLTAFDGGVSYYDDINISVSRPGDLDFDKDVDMFDLDKLVAHWFFNGCDALNHWCSGADQTGSGSVDLGDYAVTAANWLSGVYPAAPKDLVIEPGHSQTSLDWDDNKELDLAGYNIYRSLTPSSGYTRINQSLLTNSEYVDISVTNYMTYYYVVTAEDTFGYESVYSDEVSASPGVQPVMKLLASFGVTTIGDNVTKWKDQAKNNNASQSEEDDRPAFISSAINDEPAIDFDGTGKHLDVADSADINTGGPYSGKTLAVVFKTGSDIENRQVIWEQGAGVRGLSFYLDDGNLYINGWNLGETQTQWGPTALNTPISVNTAYLATLIMDSNAGTFEGFVNGTSIGIVGGIAQLHKHSGDCAFGHKEGATKFHDGTGSGAGNFAGQIAEFYQYNEALSSIDRQMLENVLMKKYGLGDNTLKVGYGSNLAAQD